MNLQAVLLYSGVDTNYYKKIYVEKLEKPTIFFISRIMKHKNVDFLLELAKAIPSAQVVIGGSGPYLQELKKNAPKNTVFLGRISEEDKRAWYCKADVFVFPALKEPLGVVPMEAMACETPVVAFNSGGPRETVENKKTGFLAKNKEEFINYVKELINNSQMRAEFGKNGRERVIKMFSVHSMVGNTEKWYKKLAK